MAATERITMTMRELDRFKVIQDVADGKLKPWRAAERLELTSRQVRRLVARLREHGPAGLVSGHRSKPGNRRLDPGAADRALSIIRDRYADFGPTLACAKLCEYAMAFGWRAMRVQRALRHEPSSLRAMRAGVRTRRRRPPGSMAVPRPWQHANPGRETARPVAVWRSTPRHRHAGAEGASVGRVRTAG
ncbi:helix-turn-helix domain-containing protein [Burkholderia territorii]|uniref:helix-turn-helix domain-containing protein n=1 Tax=Burkholderia territorii TaxID=1503055 RepID=UPI001E59D42E|nr:helix-turn-helix domain-containing protein [Burkholderia territorii]